MSNNTITVTYTGNTYRARIGKGKNAYTASCTGGANLAARAVVEKYYGYDAGKTVTKDEDGNYTFSDRPSRSASPAEKNTITTAKATKAAPSDRQEPEGLPSEALAEEGSIDRDDTCLAPGELSTGIKLRLAQAGDQIDDNRIASSWRNVEEQRETFTECALYFGLELLAVKEATPHGDFTKRVEAALKRETRFPFGETLRMARIYMQLARRFLWKMETDGFRKEAVAIGEEPTAFTITAETAATLAVQSPEEHDRTLSAIRTFIAGRSLRRLLADLRQAEKDALKAEGDQEDFGDDPGPTHTQTTFADLFGKAWFGGDSPSEAGVIPRIRDIIDLPEWQHVTRGDWLKVYGELKPYIDKIEERAGLK